MNNFGLSERYFSEEFLDEFHKPEKSSFYYSDAKPYPHIVIDNVFKPSVLDDVLSEYIDLSVSEEIEKFDNEHEKKLASIGESQFALKTLNLMHYLNSFPFLSYLEKLTGIKHLLPDPSFHGGGLHEIKRGGFLKVHADFNKHQIYGLTRKINVLIYLNKNWKEDYQGHLELWSRDMKECVHKILPIFNRMVVFSTTQYSYHGHPVPLNCPSDNSRRSLALYYYNNEQPDFFLDNSHSTIWKPRSGTNDQSPDNKRIMHIIKYIVRELSPPIIVRLLRKIIK